MHRWLAQMKIPVVTILSLIEPKLKVNSVSGLVYLPLSMVF